MGVAKMKLTSKAHCARSILGCVLAFLFAEGAGAAVSLAPAVQNPMGTVKVSGTGFSAAEAVDIYFDNSDMLLAATGTGGAFGPVTLSVPALALPGLHWITAVGRKSGSAFQKSLTVQTEWA